MKKQIRLTILFLTLFIIGLSSYGKSQPANEEENEINGLEKFLREAGVVSVDKNTVGGRTAPWIVLLDDGKAKHRAFFKYVNSQRPLPAPDSYKYEIAAYELAKLLGIEIVPPVVEREIMGVKGSLQIFLERCIKEKDRERKKLEPPEPQAFTNAMEEIKVFENLVYDECLDKDDIMVHMDNWKVCRVDFSEAFYPSLEPHRGCEITRCSKKLYEGMHRLSDDVIRSAMNAYLNDEEINALIQRKKLIIEKINKLIEEKGKEAVIFS
jgi:hypothetical protein